MSLIDKAIRRLQHRATYLRWWFRLRLQVGGRIKLRGHLGGLTVSRSFRCDGDLWLGIYSENGEIHIGDCVSASGPLIITAIERVTLGRGVLLGPNIMMTDHYHGSPRDPDVFDIAPSERSLHTRGPIVIGDFVQVGANTSILSPTTIGKSAIIGANSVVSGELKARTVHAGAPARPLNSRLPSAEK